MTFSEHFATPARTLGTATGLFGIKGLTSPTGLTRFAQASLVRAQSLARELQSFEQTPGSLEIRKLDELSDTLCRVVDMAAFLRISHPSTQMADAAQQVHELLFGFMSELNTSRPLFWLVERALKNPEVQGEARKVGEILLHDFQKSGLQYDTDPNRQDTFVQLSNNISIQGQYFLMECGIPPSQDLILKPQELLGVSPVLLARLAVPSSAMLLKGQICIPGDQPHVAEHVLATASNPETRQKIWRHLRSAPTEQVDRLDSLLKDRLDLASLAGYNNYADYELSDKLMQNSGNVDRFLTSLATSMRPLATQEIAQLGTVSAPWDYSYYLTKRRASMRGWNLPSFELPAVFDALATLVKRLYNLRLEPGDVATGEVWAPEVRRMDVFDGHKRVGMIYLDLLSRPGKQPNPAHFTIQCSRKLPSGEHQLPIIALVCDFVGQAPQQLHFHDVQTLFHEMGHAIHSMIGRTELHNVSGTRCATDFVELPSILFEKFASHPDVLKMMSPKLDTTKFLSRQAKIEKITEHWEVWHQLCLSFLDQALHGSAFSATPSSQAVANEITQRYSLYPSADMTSQYTQQFAHFGHLVSYGATYYSYLFDRCLAAMAWDILFKDSANWDHGGPKFRDEVLKWGGARDPHESLVGLFGQEFDPAQVASSLTLNR